MLTTTQKVILGCVIVAALVLVSMMMMKPKVQWKREDGMNYISGLVTAGVGSVDGNIKFIAATPTREACEAACEGAPWCNAYTWRNASGVAFREHCYGMTEPTPASAHIGNAYHFSGTKMTGAEKFDVSPYVDRAGGMWDMAKKNITSFSNTLSRRLGMEAAGGEKFHSNNCVGSFDCMSENFITEADIAAGTMMGGYQNRAVLPG
jgi:hypothetical protein